MKFNFFYRLIFLIKIVIFSNLEENYVYRINSISNNNYIYLQNKVLELSNKFTLFRLILIKKDLFYIETFNTKLRLGISGNGNVIGFSKENKIDNSKLIWKIISVYKNKYLIQNEFNNEFIEVNNNKIHTTKDILCFVHMNKKIEKKNEKCIFNFFKVFEEYKFKNKILNIIRKEPIDIIIKYIDLSDKTLNRKGIKQIYKDQDNEELRYSIRSIFQYIPWIHKIYIIMPNIKVKFLKSIGKLQDKIVYINDKQLIGYDSANIFSFTFNLFKLKNFGVSNNFIYMEDDFFIGKPLKKSDFFYYDKKTKKVVPFIFILSSLSLTY